MKDTISSQAASHAPIHISQDNARAGSTPHIVRYVLGISLFLAVLAMSLAWIVPALFNRGG
jgi:hypothetical protein